MATERCSVANDKASAAGYRVGPRNATGCNNVHRCALLIIAGGIEKTPIATRRCSPIGMTSGSTSILTLLRFQLLWLSRRFAIGRTCLRHLTLTSVRNREGFRMPAEHERSSEHKGYKAGV